MSFKAAVVVAVVNKKTKSQSGMVHGSNSEKIETAAGGNRYLDRSISAVKRCDLSILQLKPNSGGFIFKFAAGFLFTTTLSPALSPFFDTQIRSESGKIRWKVRGNRKKTGL